MTRRPGRAGQRGVLAAEPRPRPDQGDHRADPPGRGLRRGRGPVRGGARRRSARCRPSWPRDQAGSGTARANCMATGPARRCAAFDALDRTRSRRSCSPPAPPARPKGVLNTHRMLAANQQMIRQAWPFLRTERPVIVDWLPWSHTFGGNHNVNMALTRRHALRRRRAPRARDVRRRRSRTWPTCRRRSTSTSPPGTPSWCRPWRAIAAFAARFFSRLRLMFNAAAALPADAAARGSSDLAARTRRACRPGHRLLGRDRDRARR